MVTITNISSISFSLYFGFCSSFGSMGSNKSVFHVWTQNYPQNVGTCPGFTLQLLAGNPFFQSDRPDPSSTPPNDQLK